MKTTTRYQLQAAFLFVLALALVGAHVEVGMNDDWSFIRTARDLAQTGHLQYNGWSAPLIGFQAWWGALFIKLFGFSFTAARMSVWVLGLLSLPVLWRLLRSVEVTEAQAFFGLVAFIFSPLILPNLTTFMTDMPAFLLFACALLSAVKAWEAQNDGTAMLWVCATTAFGFLSGSVRQIYWLSGICFLAVLGLTRLRTWRGRVLIVACMGLTAGFGVAAAHWLARQPYVPTDSTLADLHDLSWQEMFTNPGNDLGRELIGLAVVCLPFSLLPAVKGLRRVPVWVGFVIVSAALAFTYWMASPLPWMGNTITQYGVISSHTVSFGDKVKVLPDWLVLALGTAGLTSGVYALCCAGQLRPFTVNSARGRFAALTVPFLLAYTAVLAYRATSFGLFDRYLIPLFFVAGALGLSASQKVSPLSWAVGVIFALYAVATTHDHFAEARAKLQAMRTIMHAGHARATVLGGFETDAWAQADIRGYVNNDQVDYPANAYRDADDCSGPPETQVFWRPETPDLKGIYVVSLTPLPGLAKSEFAPIEYWRWLPPRLSHVYVGRANPPLTCVAAKN